MEEVTRELRKLALAAYPMLDALMKSEFPGQRLAACAFLQIKPNSTHIEWLGERVASEVPFIKYQGALALRNAVRVLPQADRDRLRKAVQDAENALAATNRTDSDDNVLKDAERNSDDAFLFRKQVDILKSGVIESAPPAWRGTIRCCGTISSQAAKYRRLAAGELALGSERSIRVVRNQPALSPYGDLQEPGS
jgi:hypothetical protein